MRDGFVKVAAGTPKIRVADCRYNAEQIFTLMREADKQGVRVLALPELCLTGYTCGDLFFQQALQQAALSHILNAEGEKLQKILSYDQITPETVLLTNNSVESMVNSISNLETILTDKIALFDGCICSGNG